MTQIPAKNSLLIACKRILAIAIAALVGGHVATSPLAGQLIDPPKIAANTTGPVVGQLLEAGWDKAADGDVSAKSTFASAGKTSAVSLAYVVNRIHHNQPRDAITVADQLCTANPQELDGWILKAWLNTLINNYESALIDMRSAKRAVVKNAGLADFQKQEAYRRIGKMIGYLQGPVSHKVDPDLLRATVAAIAQGCSADEIKTFNSARDLVLLRYENLQKEQNAKAKSELEKQKVEDENLEMTLTKQNQNLTESIVQLKTDKETLKIEGNKRIADLTSQINPLQGQLSSVSASIAAAEQDLQLLYIDLNYILQIPPDRRPSTFFLTNQIRNREFEIQNMIANADSISYQLQQVRGEINGTRNSYNAQIRQLEKQQSKINGSVRRNQNKLAKIAGGPKLAKGKKGAMTSRLTALTSYDKLSAELYRQQMLDLIPDK